MNDIKTCQQTVYPREQWGCFHGHPCGKPAAVEHEGKWYCKVHHPPTKKAREDAKPKCALCETIVRGTKYCRIHATVTVPRDYFEALVARDKERKR